MTDYEFEFPPGEILDACIGYAEKFNDLAERLEGGLLSSIDTGTLLAHLRVLREDIPIFVEGVRAESGKPTGPRPLLIKGRPLRDRPAPTSVVPGTLFDASDASLYESDGHVWRVRIRRV